MAKASKYEQQIMKKRKKGIARLMQIAGTKSVYLIAACIIAVIAVLAQITPFVTVYLLVLVFLKNLCGHRFSGLSFRLSPLL